MTCHWPGDDPQMIAYHDHEWGRPVTDSVALFDKFMLDAFQAGLSWRIVLHKRDTLRQAFASFDPTVLAQWNDADVVHALTQPGIIRNRLKARACVTNARAWCSVERNEGGFARLLWQRVDFQPVIRRPRTVDDIPTSSELSEQISKDLKRRGFSFCGPVMVYAFLEAVGVINNHMVTCPEQPTCTALAAAVRPAFSA